MKKGIISILLLSVLIFSPTGIHSATINKEIDVHEYTHNIEVFAGNLNFSNPDSRYTGASSSTIPGFAGEYFFRPELALSVWGMHFDDALKFEDVDRLLQPVQLNVTYKCPIYGGGLSYYFNTSKQMRTYVTGGLAIFKNQFLFTPVTAGAGFMSNSHFEKTENGFYVGGGLDYHISRNYSANLQFTQLFGDSQVSINSYNLSAAKTDANVKLDRSIIRLGIRAWFY